MHGCKLSGSYPRNYAHARNFPKHFVRFNLKGSVYLYPNFLMEYWHVDWIMMYDQKLVLSICPLPLTQKALGFFLPSTGECFPLPLCKIRSRHPRKLKFTGLIAYVMFYKICKFESLTIINDVITKNNGKIWYLTLTSIQFDPDNQEIWNLERW